MRIPSGVTDQYIYFVAVDATDLKTFETGISAWTVRRSRNGGASAAYTTPTINETDSANMPGVYELLLDEDMTIDAGDDSQEVVLRITATGVAPITRVFELYRPKLTAGETLSVSSGGLGAIAANVVNASALATDAVTEIVTAVWAATTRILTAGTNIVLAKGTGVTGFNDVSTAQVNAEVDTALADYDAPTNAEMEARTLPAASYGTAANQTIINDNVSAVGVLVADIPNNAEFAAAMTVIDTDFTGIENLINALNNPSANAVATAVMNYSVDAPWTFQQAVRLMLAATAGTSDGAEYADPIQFYLPGGTKARISMTGDQYGNRSNPTYDVSDA